MTSQIDLSSGRIIKITTAGNAADPTDVVTAPTITLPPQSSSGLKTTGCIFFLKQPPVGGAVPTAGGFGVTLWVQNAATGDWAAGATNTIDFRQAFDTYDFDAINLYVQIDPATVGTPGDIWVEIMPQ